MIILYVLHDKQTNEKKRERNHPE